MKWRVLITCPHLQRTLDRYQELFRQHQIEVEAPPCVQPLGERELIPIVSAFDGVIAGDDEFSAAVLEQAERLRVVVKWGIGVDAIDIDAARRLGIRVFNTPGVFAESAHTSAPAADSIMTEYEEASATGSQRSSLGTATSPMGAMT